MSYHGKLQTLKNGTADAEIQLWAYQQLEKEPVELTDEEIDKIENAVYCKTIQKGKTQNEYIKAFARAILRKVQKK